MEYQVDLLQTFFCWSTLVVTVALLGGFFFLTNVTAYARKTRRQKKESVEPTFGSTPNSNNLV